MNQSVRECRTCATDCFFAGDHELRPECRWHTVVDNPGTQYIDTGYVPHHSESNCAASRQQVSPPIRRIVFYQGDKIEYDFRLCKNQDDVIGAYEMQSERFLPERLAISEILGIYHDMRGNSDEKSN